jgi:hypothetical protein
VTLRIETGDDGPEGEQGRSELVPQSSRSSTERAVLFHVEDTGPGIAAPDLARIFEPFEQAGDHGARAQGVGLGLAISRRIIDQMGGRMDVRSAPGEGSTFTVALRLPVIREEKPTREESAAEAITGYEGPRPPSGPLIPPSPEVIARLCELVERGRLQELAQELLALEAENRQLGPWLQKARALAEGFQVRELHAMLVTPDPRSAR